MTAGRSHATSLYASPFVCSARFLAGVAFLLAALVAPTALAFSVLAHQAVVDRSWESVIVPALRRQFPNATAEEIEKARSFAYGGSHIADLGYFPLGNKTFTDLVHYVRSGEFVTTLVQEARTLDEYAFALGAVSHHVTDVVGHAQATNRAVPEMFPKLRERYGDEVTYGDDGPSHFQTEFRFDVLQMARNPQARDRVRHAVGFEVAKPVLERAFRKTYGLGLDDLFVSTDVAITTYRWAFRNVVHEATGIAWGLYGDDIRKLDPSVTEKEFVSEMSRDDFEEDFGKAYREPGYLTKFFGLATKLVPQVGPLKRAPFAPLPADVQQQFVTALDHAVARYRATVPRVTKKQPLENDILDTGRPAYAGEYEPADEAYVALVDKLAERDFVDVPPALRAAILRFYSCPAGCLVVPGDREEAKGTRRKLAELASAVPER